uniref:F-box domain-containing protein n=1 Tax=Sus scrofa TaxID=9823 RepID=A0A8D0XND8_PIG
MWTTSDRLWICQPSPPPSEASDDVGSKRARRQLEAEEALGLNQLPSELLLMLLSHMPPRTLIRHCCPVCRRWHALVDCQVLWLIILAWDHHALWPVLQTCLPPIEDTKPSILGRFCVCRPVGRTLMSSNPEGDMQGTSPWAAGEESDPNLSWAVEGNLEVMPRVHLQICFLSASRECPVHQALVLSRAHPSDPLASPPQGPTWIRRCRVGANPEPLGPTQSCE